jgi:hypothetical protein
MPPAVAPKRRRFGGFSRLAAVEALKGQVLTEIRQ